MKMNFLKYSAYVLITLLNVANSLGAMDAEEQTEGSGLKRTHAVCGRLRSHTVVEDSPPLLRLTSSNGSDSQRSYNEEFDLQTLRETRTRYAKALTATESDADTEEDGEGEEDNKATKKARTDVHTAEVRFSDHISMRGCPNFVEDVIAVNTDGTTTTVEKKTKPFGRYSSQIAQSAQKNKYNRTTMRKHMANEWEYISEIKNHPIFTHKFKRELNKIAVGLKNLKDAKILAIEDDSLTGVFQSFATWEQAHLNPNQILQDLVTKLGSLGVHTRVNTTQLEEAMDQEYTRHTDALNAERIRLMAANVFQCSVAVGDKHSDGSYSAASAVTNGEALSSDVESSVLGNGIGSDAGSVSGYLNFGDKTDLQYFDSLIERYGQVLTTFKNDLIRLKKDST